MSAVIWPVGCCAVAPVRPALTYCPSVDRGVQPAARCVHRAVRPTPQLVPTLTLFFLIRHRKEEKVHSQKLLCIPGPSALLLRASTARRWRVVQLTLGRVTGVRCCIIDARPRRQPRSTGTRGKRRGFRSQSKKTQNGGRGLGSPTEPFERGAAVVGPWSRSRAQI